MSFKAKMQKAAKSKNSRIILALDFPFEAVENREKVLAKAQKVLKAVHPYICAVKINHHLVLPLVCRLGGRLKTALRSFKAA